MADIPGKELDSDLGRVPVTWEDQGDGTYAKRNVDRNYIWDSGSLSWVRQAAGGGGGGGPATIADGADVVEGALADAAIVTDTTGTVNGKLRGLIKILASVWDSVNGRLKVDGSAVTQPVSGTFWQATQPVSGTFWQATQPVSVATALDVSDRAARLLGKVYGDQGVFTQRAVSLDAQVQLRTAGTEYDARSIRALTSADVVDVSDRAARLVGRIYGSQGQQLTQTATNFNAQVELATGSTLYDARQIRALTTADAVNVGQWIGSAAPTVGSKTSANSVPVVVASDQGAIPVSESGTWTVQPGNTANTTPWLVAVATEDKSTYEVATAELTLGTAVAKNRIISLFHPSANVRNFDIIEIWLFFKAKHTAGIGQYKISFTTAESATGTVLNPQSLNIGDQAAGMSARSATTADGTLNGNPFIGYTGGLAAITGNVSDSALLLYLWRPETRERPIQLQASTAVGILVYQDVTSALTTAPIVSARVKWIER